MQTITRNTLEIILKTFESTSTDETRPHLNCVRIASIDPTASIVEATDGHILTRHFLTVDNFELNDDVLIDRVGKAKLKSFLTSNKHTNKFKVDFNVEENRNLRIYTTDNRDGTVLPVVFKDYPKTDAVIPKIGNEEEYYEVAFNPALLTKLYKSMNGEKRQKVKLKIRKDNNFSPILVESGNNNLGIIMPLRG